MSRIIGRFTERACWQTKEVERHGPSDQDSSSVSGVLLYLKPSGRPRRNSRILRAENLPLPGRPTTTGAFPPEAAALSQAAISHRAWMRPGM